MELLQIFLHSGVRELTLAFYDNCNEWSSDDDTSVDADTRMICRVLGKIPKVATNITQLTIDMPDVSVLSAFKKQFGMSLPLFRNLEVLRASSFRILTPFMIESLKNLPNLKEALSIKMQDVFRSQCQALKRHVRGIDDNTCYSSLEYLQLYGTVSGIKTILERSHFPRLISLRLMIEVDSLSVIDVVNIAAIHCRTLEDLTLVFSGSVNATRQKKGTLSLHLEDFPLKTLKIYGGAVSEKGLVDLVRRMPRLESLRVGPHVRPG